MKIAARRRLAAGGGLLSAALVAGLLVTAGPASAVVAPASGPAFNDRSQDVTFTTADPVPPGSFLRFRRVGGTEAEAFTVPVTGNDMSLRRPTVTLDLRDPQANAVTMSPGAGPANPGTYSVAVVSFGAEGESCTGCFSVLSPTKPAVTKVEPTGTPRGTAPEVRLTGVAFARDTAITVVNVDRSAVPADQEITVSLPSGDGPFATNTELRRVFTVPATAALGPRTLLLRNTDGETAVCERCFSVLGGAITSISPTEARNTPDATAVPITFTAPAGTFGPDASVTLVYAGSTTGSSTQQGLSIPGTVTSRSVSGGTNDGSTLVATFDLTGEAPGMQAYLPTVTSTTGGTNLGPRFTLVQPDAPTVTGVAPPSQVVGRTETVSLSGTGFAEGAVVTFERAADGLPPTTETVTATSVDVRSTTTAVVTVTFASDAATGPRTVRLRNTDGASGTCAGCYTVNAAPSPSPSMSGTPSPSPSASRSPSATPTVSASPSRSATPTVTPSRSATPTPSASPALQRPTVSISPSEIIAVEQKAVVSGTAAPGSRLELVAYSRPSTDFVTVRDITVPADGRYSFVVGPSGNTRLFVRSSGGGQTANSPQAVLQVRTSLNLKVARTGTKTYRFTGSLLPKRPGQLITVFYEKADGSRVIAARARNAANGTYNVTRTFTGGGTFVLYTGTGTDNNNRANNSNRVRVTIR